jgi:hypothetical protein
VSVGPDPNINVQLIEETRRQINRLFEEVARLSEQDLPPSDYYGEVLKRVLQALAAPAGAVWVRNPQGNLLLQYQINLQMVGIARSDQSRQSHDEMLRQVFQQGKPVHLPPHASAGQGGGDKAGPGNPTDYIVLLAPILVDKQAAGVIEVWQNANRHPDAIQGFLQFLVRMADLCSLYTRNHLLRTMGGQQQLWSQLETFARQVHGSLNPTEVAYQVANEGRRLIVCDRVCVGVRHGRKTVVEAISGADVVERRSRLVVLMRKLMDRVVFWGEKLVYSGSKDDTLPPDVLQALDDYLAESQTKLLAVLPLRDERQGESKKPARSAMMVECFEPNTTPEQLVSRAEVVSKHATTALYNAVEHKRIPFRFVWGPMAKVQEGLGGKTRAIILAIALGLVGLGAALYFVPYPLKMDATGQLLPEVRQWVYPPETGDVVRIDVQPNSTVLENQSLLVMRSLPLKEQLIEIEKDISTSSEALRSIERRLAETGGRAQQNEQQTQLLTERAKHEATVRARMQQLEELRRQIDLLPGGEPMFEVKAPTFPMALGGGAANAQWTILNADFREHLLNRNVKPSDPMLRLGYKEGRWEIELKVPQKHIGQVLAAYDYVSKQEGRQVDELDVDLLVRSDPTRVFTGKLHRDRIGGEAKPNQTDQNESEPIVLAYVRIDGDDIPADEQLPRDLLVTGTEVRAKVRCGNHRMGYSLFYGVWEFFYEKVVFFF